MEAITIYNRQEIAPAQEFNPGLFNDFVSWIDRSEKTARTYLTNLKQFMAWLQNMLQNMNIESQKSLIS